MQLRIPVWAGLVLAWILASGPAGAMSISFADLTRDTVLTSDNLQFTGFNSFEQSDVFDPDEWLLTVIEDQDTLRIEPVNGPLMLGPEELIKFDLRYRVTPLDPSVSILSMGLFLPDDSTATSGISAIKVDKEVRQKRRTDPIALLEGFDWSCEEGDTECPGRQLQDSVDFGAGFNELWIKESVTLSAISGQIVFGWVDNRFVVPEPTTAAMLLLGLAGMSWFGRRPS